MLNLRLQRKEVTTMAGVRMRVIAWAKGIDHPVDVYERDNCDYVQRRMPNANLRILLEQTVFNLTHGIADRMEWTIVPDKQPTLFDGGK